MEKYDCLKLENQLCFPLYAASKEVVKKYTPYLDELGLTYTQYIALMVLWDNSDITVKELGERLFLDSGTLTPLLKKLESKGIVRRNRDPKDERSLRVNITEEGKKLRDKAIGIPEKVDSCIPLDPKEAETLYILLHKVLRGVSS